MGEALLQPVCGECVPLVRRAGKTPEQKEGEEEGEFRERVKREYAAISRFECSHCKQHLSGQNEYRLKLHSMNPKACKYLSTSAAWQNPAQDVGTISSSSSSSSSSSRQ